MGRIWNKLKSFIYAVPFGMKGAESVIMGDGKGESSDGTVISHEVDEERLSHGLIKGEVTQEVADLRYRTYKVDKEASKYEYIGGGLAVKDESRVADNTNKKRFRFTQANKLNYGGVYEGYEYADVNNRHIFEIAYNSTVRFKLEKYITEIDVLIDNEKGEALTTMHFSLHATPNDVTSKAFINELLKIVPQNRYGDPRSEILDTMESLAFSTYKANGEADFVTYAFTNGAKLSSVSVSEDGNEVLIAFLWGAYMRLPVNLEDKYYSENIAKKYDAKAPKDTPIEYVPNNRMKKVCCVCGKEIVGEVKHYIDDIMPICDDCIKSEGLDL